MRTQRGRATAGVEEVGENYYRRTIRLEGQHGLVEVRYLPGQSYLVANILFPKVTALGQQVGRMRRMFGLGANALPKRATRAGPPYLGTFRRGLTG